MLTIEGLWETYLDCLDWVLYNTTIIYRDIIDYKYVNSPDESFTLGTYVNGDAIVGYKAVGESNFVDTAFTFYMSTSMTEGQYIYQAPFGSCVLTGSPVSTGLNITASNGAITFNAPVTRYNFESPVVLNAVSIGWNANQKPLYDANQQTAIYQGTSNWVGVNTVFKSTNSVAMSGTVYYNPLPSGATTFNNYRQNLVDYVNDNNGDLQDITIDDVPTWQELTGEDPTEPTEETTEPATDSNGNVIINNYDILNIDNTISGNADIDFNGSVDIDVSAGAGAFGAGAVVVSGKVDASLTNSGDFVLNPSGTLDIAEISLNGDTVTYNQNYTVDSGGTVTNNNITNNYYQYIIESGAVEGIPLPSYPAIDFTLEYDEILSEREFYDILSTETYYIEPLETGVYSLELQTVPPMPALPEQLTLVSGAVMSEGVNLLDDFGLSSVYTPLAIFTIVCYILKRGR